MGKVPLLLGTAVAGIIGLAMTAGSANASAAKGGGKSKTAPNGADFDTLARDTTDALRTQQIADVRQAVKDWAAAKDPETSGALAFTIEQAVAGASLAESKLDGDAGSPLLRAFGLRVLQLEGRKPRLDMWQKAWKPVLPLLAAALKAKADALGGQADKADPIPDEATMARILEAVQSQDTARMRQVAKELDSLGFPDAAADLRAMADMIDQGKAHADPKRPEPTPAPEPEPEPKPQPKPHDEVVPGPEPKHDDAPPISTERMAAVKKGEGISQFAGRVLGSKSQGLARWRELLPLNVPPYKRDGKGNVLLQPGDFLNIPPSWPDPNGITVPGRSSGPGGKGATKPKVIDAGGGKPAPIGSTRMIVVQKGWGVAQAAMAAKKGTSEPYTDADRKRLRDFNVPPFKKTPDGSGLILNPGDRLRVPPEWPVSPIEVMGGAGVMTPRQLRAARIALDAKFNKLDRSRLAAFQQAERIEPTGDYGPATAIVLCERFGIVPALPITWGGREAQNRQAFARRMYNWAKRDGQRGDEFRLVARQAEGRAP